MSASKDTKQGTPLEQKDFPPYFVREQLLIRLLMTYIGTGVFFMLLPGTFLGVWNLFAISGGHSPQAVPDSWIQAHGHAQLFGWIGTFILGIGFYSIPNLRKVASFNFQEAWVILVLWATGVAIRWVSNVYQWQWRLLIPVSAILEIVAFLGFFYFSFKGYRAKSTQARSVELWVLLVLSGCVGLLASLVFNLVECFDLSLHAIVPAIPQAVDHRYLFLSTWGFAVPIAWGLTARWMPPLLGLKESKKTCLYAALSTNVLAVISAVAGFPLQAACLSILAAALIPLGLRLFEPTASAAKTSGVHVTFPVFMRIAYIWVIVAAALQLWAAFGINTEGISGAARHALTVGFLATMVFTVGPRMLPAFLGRKQLYSGKLMFASLALLSLGCLLRVSFEVLAYQHYLSWAWTVLPVSASLELLAVTLFGVNMIATLRQPPLMPVMDEAYAASKKKK
ncbi:MAG TPA: NnrS family protein [Candidatus Obscuribacterales bacterium]